MDEHTTESATAPSRKYNFDGEGRVVPDPISFGVGFSPLDDTAWLSIAGHRIVMSGYDLHRLAEHLAERDRRYTKVRKEIRALVLEGWARRNAAESNEGAGV